MREFNAYFYGPHQTSKLKSEYEDLKLKEIKGR